MKTQSGVSMQTQINNLFQATKHHNGDDPSSQDTFCFDTHNNNTGHILNKTTTLASKSTAFASTIQGTKAKNDKSATALTAKAIMEKLAVNKTPNKNSRKSIVATKENKPKSVKRTPSAVANKSATKKNNKKRTVK